MFDPATGERLGELMAAYLICAPGHAAGAQRAHRAGGDPGRRADLAGRDLAAGGDLKAHRLAGPASLLERKPRARGGGAPASGAGTGRRCSRPFPRPGWCSGLDMGARFLRGAICDLHGGSGPVRTSRPPAPTRVDLLDDVRPTCAAGSLPTVGWPWRRLTARSSVCPAWLTPTAVGCGWPRTFPASRGSQIGSELADAARRRGVGRERHQPRRGRRALAGRRLAGSTTSPSCRSAPGSARGW